MTMWENARYLANAGHQVTYVAAGYPGAAAKETVDGIRVIHLGGVHSLWLRSFIYYLRSGRGRYDVVVTEGFGGSRIPRLAPLYVREPVLTEWHQIHRDLFAAQYPRLLNGPLNVLERATAWIHRNTRVRAGTEEWQRAFPQIGFRPENVFLVPVSIRDDWLNSPNDTQPAGPVILWIGKLRRYKCPDHAVLAMPEVLKSVASAKLIISGRRDDADYERKLRSLVAKLGLEETVEFRFNVSEPEKRDLYDMTKVLVLPSAVEGFGIVVLEANACGVPVVASSRVPEGAVRDGLNGLRYPFGDITELAGALVRTLSDDGLHERLSAGGREFAKSFAWTRVGARYEQVVIEAAARHRAPAASKT